MVSCSGREDAFGQALSYELQDRVLGWLSPTDLSRFSRTSKQNELLVEHHWDAYFKMHHAVGNVLCCSEAEQLQTLLDRTGSFIWGVAVYQFFVREEINWLALGISDDTCTPHDLEHHEPYDLDIFVHYGNLSHFIHFLSDWPCFSFKYDAEYVPEMGATLDDAKSWLKIQADDDWLREKQSVIGVVRFTRLPRYLGDKTAGVRLIVTRRSTWESLLLAKNSEYFTDITFQY